MIADALRAVAKFPELLTLPIEAIRALVDWLDGDEDHPEPVGATAQLPGTLKSELALARAEARAAKQG